MTIAQLECFLALVTHLNFTRAADTMFVTQPAFSRRISGLEEELGVKLFVRGNKDISLTMAGEIYYAAAQKAIHILEEAAAEARKADSGKVGRIRIGSLWDARELVLVKTVDYYRDNHSNISLQIAQYSQSGIEDALVNNEIDIGFFNSYNREFIKKMDSIVLERSLQCVVVRPQHPFAKRESVSLAELRDEQFALLGKNVSPYYEILSREFRKLGLSLRIAAFGDVATEVLNYVRNGTAIGFFSKRVELVSQPELYFIPIEELPPVDHLAVWQPSNPNAFLPEFICRLEQNSQPLKMYA